MSTVIDLSALSTDGLVIQGDAAGDNAGFSVSSAGDVNGDGLVDLIVGARLGDDGGSNAGEAYVIFGKADGLANIDLTGLAPSDGFVIQGDTNGDYAGYSVASAGDVNGDGYDDLIVGARGGDNGGSGAGEAYVIFGKASGFTNIDLATLAPADGFIIQGDLAGDQAGRSVSSAGDINGDGYDDIIVGAPFGDDGGADAGEAYVIFGKAAGFANIDLSALAPADGFIIQGDYAGDQAGRSVSSAGDINGDGFDDIIIGALYGDDGGTNAGEAYVIFGKAAGFTNIDLSALAPADGFIIQGAGSADNAGRSVSSAGDFNRDGYDDLLVGAPLAEVGFPSSGETYVIFGKASFTNINLASLAATDGFVLRGLDTGDQAGFSVSEAGDVNGDGFADVIVGAPYDDDGGVFAGQAYVVYGKASGFSTIALGAIQPEDGFIIQGGAAEDRAGFSVSAAGDINGDGFDDVIVGARTGDDGGYDAGEAYIVFGFGAGAFPLLFDLAEDVRPSSAFIIQGDAAGDQAGRSVSSAGDVNNDGYDDLIVGARRGDDGGNSAGEAYIVFGKAGGFATIDLTGLAATDGFVIQGDAALDQAGFSVSSAGDVNGDGYDDIVIGAPYGDNGGNNAGEAYVIFGKASGFATIDLTGLAVADGFIIQGDFAGDWAGWSVSGAGDVNDDGFDDIIVGARLGDDGGNAAGEAYVIFGKAAGFATIDLTGLSATDGFIIQGDAIEDHAGFSVSSGGDVNGDGFADLIVGARLGDDGALNAGEAYVIFGKASGFGTIDLTGLAATDGFIIQGDSNADLAGHSVASAGDVNGDGYDDLIVGAPRGNDGGADAGEAYVIFGKASGFGTIDLTGLAGADGFIIQGDAGGDYAGYSVGSAGDINGDGFDDLLVGAFRGDDGGTDAGETYVIFGKAGGFATLDLATLAVADGFIVLGDAGGDRAGRSASAAGDVNGDGFDDIIVGAPYGDNGGADAGEAYVIFGRGPTAAVTRIGSAADQIIHGSAFDDLLDGAGGDDTLLGNAGDDVLIGGAGSNSLDGADGSDTADYSAAAGGVDASLIAQLATDNGHGGTDQLDSIENLIGSAFADVLTGNNLANFIDGGAGADTMTGGVGDDRYIVDHSLDAIIEAGGGGTDLAESSVTYTLGASVDNLTLTGTAGINGTGNGGANTIIGNEGNNILAGAAAGDTLIGNDGNDTIDGGTGIDDMQGGDGDDAYYVDNALDLTVELSGNGFDTVYSSISHTLGSQIERLSLIGTDVINATGNSLDNVLLGNSAANQLNGSTGADEMRGFDGDDTYFVDNAGDQVFEINPAGGTDTVQSSVSFVLGSYLENLVLTGAGSVDATGNTLVNSLTGNSGANVINGGAGADTMAGLTGDDSYIVDNAGDVVIEAAGSGTDLVSSGVDYVLGASIENLTLTGSAVNGTGNGAANTITGNNAANILSGAGANDILIGGFGTDTLDGGDLHDSLYGGASSDDLTGGAGFDGFYFDAALNAVVNVDDILDFAAADDTIYLDRDIFTGLAANGAIGAAAFRLGTVAVDADDRILYDSATGQIQYDADGVGGVAAILFATVTAGLALTSADFVGY